MEGVLGGGGVDGEEQEEEEEEEEGRRWQWCSKLCISVNTQPLTLINLPFSLLVCVWEGEGGLVFQEKNPLLSYMHMAVHQLIAGRKKKRKKASLQSSLWSPCVPVWAQVTLFLRDEGWRGGGGGCLMSVWWVKRVLKLRRESWQESAFALPQGKGANKSHGNENK